MPFREIVALAGFLGLFSVPGAFAEEPIPPLQDTGHADHQHHHHAAVPDTRRSQGSYSIPDVTLIDQHGEAVWPVRSWERKNLSW